jgi:hypothetical protein
MKKLTVFVIGLRICSIAHNYEISIVQEVVLPNDLSIIRDFGCGVIRAVLDDRYC